MESRCTHFDVKDAADKLKKVASDSEATALASIVFPLPGGPKRRRPEEILIMLDPQKWLTRLESQKFLEARL